MESLPPELLSQIAQLVPLGWYPRFIKTSRSFYTAGEPYIYDKQHNF